MLPILPCFFKINFQMLDLFFCFYKSLGEIGKMALARDKELIHKYLLTTYSLFHFIHTGNLSNFTLLYTNKTINKVVYKYIFITIYKVVGFQAVWPWNFLVKFITILWISGTLLLLVQYFKLCYLHIYAIYLKEC